jgi:hypothetical protein
MEKDDILKMLHALVDKKPDEAQKHLSDVLTAKATRLVAEDHEKEMTSEELHKYVTKLWAKAKTDEHKKEFLEVCAKHSGEKSCTDKQLEDCCEKVCAKGKKKCDALIHALEKVLGITPDPKKAKEEVVNEARERTTEDEYVIQGKYEGKWEDLDHNQTMAEAKVNLKAYRENEKGTEFKLVHRKVKKNKA